MASGLSQQPTVDFGFFKPAALGDYVWYDYNHDGVQNDGPTGVSGISVTLLFAGNPVSNTVTDASGGYSFTNLTAGTYQVQFTLPGNLTFTLGSPANPAADGTDSDVAPGAQSATTDRYENRYEAKSAPAHAVYATALALRAAGTTQGA